MKLGKRTGRIAFYGRVARDQSTDASLAAQLAACQRVIERHSIVVAVFCDPPGEEPLRLGRRRVRRDGGLADLLSEAVRFDRRFHSLILTDPDRLDRDMRRACDVIEYLQRCGVTVLFPPNSPIPATAVMPLALLTDRSRFLAAAWRQAAGPDAERRTA